MIVIVPTVRPVMMFSTFGMLEMGEVPRVALTDNPTPNDIINSPTQSTMYLFMISEILRL